MIMEEVENKVSLFVVRTEIYGRSRNTVFPILDTYKEDKCIICIEDSPNILFCNCGHLILCESCYERLENTKCPKCREFNNIIKKI